MKYLGIAGVAVLALWGTGLGFESGGEDSRPSLEPPSPEERPGAMLSSDTDVDPGILKVPQTVPETRRSSSRRRSRYPGPIPTPAEWEPPEGPVRIALQAGHWKAADAGTAEWEVNLAVAETTAGLLRELGYEVDILPAVVPPGYRAHLFIAIHADGSNDPNASGYRVATPSRDATGRASGFADLLEKSYGEATSIRLLPTVTRRMRNYYAFNFRRYEHALHPMTIGVIIETGFITSARDRRVILNEPKKAARGIVNAIVEFPVTPPPTKPAPTARDTTKSGGMG